MKLSGVSILQKYVKKTLKFDLVFVIVLFVESKRLDAYYITKLIKYYTNTWFYLKHIFPFFLCLLQKGWCPAPPGGRWQKFQAPV